MSNFVFITRTYSGDNWAAASVVSGRASLSTTTDTIYFPKPILANSVSIGVQSCYCCYNNGNAQVWSAGVNSYGWGVESFSVNSSGTSLTLTPYVELFNADEAATTGQVNCRGLVLTLSIMAQYA